ncbi:hypothetical protein [Acidithiobacillus sp.]|uniref:hypothetical protein n=1 Tax=Acidithiobacillus sp. TaxID=1872118 RepID=UPI002608F9D4|nr:hypothetical protein [Acidithiobacillus sp.]
MIDLNDFLQQTVAGYLFNDLRTMQVAELPPGQTSGALGYPLLMSTFAGIELLGGLLFARRFNAHQGEQHFTHFWVYHLYPSDPVKRAAGVTLYKLVRHGLAHVYATKGKFIVEKNEGRRHLQLLPSEDGRDQIYYIDAGQLASDLITSYRRSVEGASEEDKRRMQENLNGMATIYQSQSSRDFASLLSSAGPSTSSVRPVDTSMPSSASPASSGSAFGG